MNDLFIYVIKNRFIIFLYEVLSLRTYEIMKKLINELIFILL